MSNFVSLTMIVRNEEQSLGACLTSVVDLVDEIIVVDTGSIDDTKEVARRFGAGVYDFVWDDDFAAARNESLSHACGNWILWLDADEYLDESNREKMRSLIGSLSAEKTAFLMRQHSRTHEGLAISVHQVRLFRNDPEIRWEYRVHEQILPALQEHCYEIHATGITISHTGYEDFSKYADKMQRNLRMLLLDMADRPDDPFTLFNIGLAYSKLGSHLAAEGPLLRSLGTLPLDSYLRPKAHAALIRTYLQLGKLDQASSACLIARNQSPENLELLGLDGTLRLVGGDQAGAESCWKQVLWSRPDAPVSSWGLDLPAEHASLLDPMLSLGNEIDADEAVFPCAGHNLASLFRQQGRSADAEAQWVNVQEDYPGFIPAWVGLGELYIDHNQWTELDRIIQAMEREPRLLMEALVLRAQSFLARQEFDKAREFLHLALSYDADFQKAKEILSHVLLLEGKQPAMAEVLLQEILQSDPRNAQAWLNLIALVRQQGRLAQSATLCQDARAHCPNDPDLLLIHGTILQEQGKCDQAEICLLPLLANSFRSAEDRQRCLTARHYLACVHRDRGHLAVAIDQWQNLLADTPDDLAAWVGLAEVHLARRDVNACSEIARRLSWRPDWGLEAKVLQARVALAGKDYLAARGFLEEVLADRPRDQRAMVLFSQALLREGNDWIAAEGVLRGILKMNPQNIEAQHNLKVLLEWQGRSIVNP